ncbi:hypothetical protein VMT65_01785 [Nocardia sp. CDC153]|uniref:hypothetical protein n=1 Tax=Nocardia sp. CDC153 TaxID=3112167 RepID=UPI002DBA0A28|nr:hypothetical protein [Nocardia sp. CDC153]MEC3951754.1 hypothetical protein [Nocardia sp. CDC153]
MADTVENTDSAPDSVSGLDRAFAVLLIFVAALALLETVIAQWASQQWGEFPVWVAVVVRVPVAAGILAIAIALRLLFSGNRSRATCARAVGVVGAGLLLGIAYRGAVQLASLAYETEGEYIDAVYVARLVVALLVIACAFAASGIGILAVVPRTPAARTPISRADRLLGPLAAGAAVAALVGNCLINLYERLPLRDSYGRTGGGTVVYGMSALEPRILVPLVLPWLVVMVLMAVVLAVLLQLRLPTARPALRIGALLVAAVALGPDLLITLSELNWYLYQSRLPVVEIWLGPGFGSLCAAALVAVAALVTGTWAMPRPRPEPAPTG